jgi:EAL domain-containing protein (putative c-di-GMP-specific phosphodiesterase class I)
LRELKALGLRLAIDDFGTGYCNLTYLQRFPLDILKIDKSFVTGLREGGGSEDGAIASTIVGLAASLKLHTVAEGVENADQRAHLIALGCSSGQGYHFARPVTSEAVTELMKSGVALAKVIEGIAAAGS